MKRASCGARRRRAWTRRPVRTRACRPGPPASRDPDALVDGDVDEVDEDIDEHVAEGDQQHRALDGRVVATEDAVDHEPTDPRDAEDGLDDHRAAKKLPEQEPN